MVVHLREFRSTSIGISGKKPAVSVRKLTTQTVQVNVDHAVGKDQLSEEVAVAIQARNVTLDHPVLRMG